MKRLIDTRGIDKAEWLRMRKQGITGTDAASIVGLNPFKSAMEVWQDKLSDDITEYDNEAMRQGRDLEDYVARRFEEETGLKVRKANAIFQNEEHPVLLADFDRVIVGVNSGLECKTVSPYSADKWKDSEIPPHYYMQVQHYLAVSGFDSWYIAALILGKEFIVRKVERDQELIDSLILVEERFWNENVLKGVMPEPDGSKACSDYIASRYSVADREKEIELPGVGSSLKRRDEIDELICKLEKEKNQIEQDIKLRMEDASYAVTEGYRITWSNVESQRLDSKRLKADHPDLYSAYTSKSQSRRFSVKVA